MAEMSRCFPYILWSGGIVVIEKRVSKGELTDLIEAQSNHIYCASFDLKIFHDLVMIEASFLHAI